MMTIKYDNYNDNYMIRTAQQRDPPKPSALGDHVYPNPAHLSHFCILRGTCTRSFESIGESLARQETKTKTGVTHTAEDTSLIIRCSNNRGHHHSCSNPYEAVQKSLERKSHRKT